MIPDAAEQGKQLATASTALLEGRPMEADRGQCCATLSVVMYRPAPKYINLRINLKAFQALSHAIQPMSETQAVEHAPLDAHKGHPAYQPVVASHGRRPAP